MKPGASIKTFLIFVGTLILVQLFFFSMIRSKNVANAEKEGMQLQQLVSELTIEKEFLQERLDGLQAQYDNILSTVPRRILDGFGDQEQMLAGFLDYIGTIEIEEVESKVTLQGERKYNEKPVPVNKYDLVFDFSFQELPDGEEFLLKVLGQDYYPLVVKSFDLRKTGRLRIAGKMDVTLHIPARQETPLAGIRREAR